MHSDSAGHYKGLAIQIIHQSKHLNLYFSVGRSASQRLEADRPIASGSGSDIINVRSYGHPSAVKVRYVFLELRYITYLVIYQIRLAQSTRRQRTLL